MPLEGSEILAEANDRLEAFAEHQARWTTLSMVYHGQYHKLYPREFRAGEVPKIAGFIRRSWSMFERLIGKVPDKRVEPLKLGSRAQNKADKLEKLCFGYDQLWAMRRKANVIGHYLAGFGALGMGVIPDPRAQNPIFLVEDPRNCLPGAGWDSTSTAGVSGSYMVPIDGNSIPADLGGTLDDMIVRKTMTGKQIRDIFGYADKGVGLRDLHLVLHYYDAKYWTVVLATNGEILSQAEHGCDWCPWQFPTIFAADAPAGTSPFEQQIGLEVAFLRLLDQKLALNDAVAWPWVVQKGFWQVDPVNRIMKAQSVDAAIDTLSPPPEFQVDRDMSLLRDLLRTMNFETEATQGDISGGPITGRGIVELDRVVVETVQSFFDDQSFYLPKIYTTAMMIDRNVFGNVHKTLAGRGRGETFFTDYTPAKDIGDEFGLVTVEFGPGLGGLEGHIQRLQSLGAEAISVEEVMEADPSIRSVSDTRRRVVVEKMRKIMIEQGLSGQAAVPLEWLARGIKEIAAGKDPDEWFATNPPEQATATPAGVPPVPPGEEILQPLAAQAFAAGGPGAVQGDKVFAPADVGALLG